MTQRERMDPTVILLSALHRILDAVEVCQRLHMSPRQQASLSPEDRLAREKLWPLVEKEGKEGKRATLIGPFALIDGKKMNYWDVKLCIWCLKCSLIPLSSILMFW
uniref:Uncharacterized protein n=1 Tax=Knipowitschia caucasica TaxID=637954 RepID=A0AAV2LK43_KNICA